MTATGAREVQQYGKELGIEVRVDYRGSVWCVEFRDVMTTDYIHAFERLQHYGKIREYRMRVA